MAFFAKRFFAQRFFAKRYWSSGEGVPGQLTGENANTAQGLLKPAIAVDLLGLVTTTAYGELTPDTGAGGGVTQALTGLVATGSLGELHVVLDIPLVGEDAVSAQGVLGADADGSISVALVGQATTGAQGQLGVSIECQLGGLRATLAAGRINELGRVPGQHDLWTRPTTTALFVVAEAEEVLVENDNISLVATQIDVFSTATTQNTDTAVAETDTALFVLAALSEVLYHQQSTDLVVMTLDAALFVVEPEADGVVESVEEDLIAA